MKSSVLRRLSWGAVALALFSTIAVSSVQGQLNPTEADPLIEVPEMFDLEIFERPEISPFGASQQDPFSWGLDRIDQVDLPLDSTYNYDNDGTGVKVYVVDTGIRRTHEDFGSRIEAGYVAPLTGETTTDDCEGHGTHVAGTVGGTRSGVAKNVTIVPVRVFNCAGTSQGSWLVQGIRWIIDNHRVGEPAVANLSLGSDEPVPAVDQAVRDLIADGVTVVVAAGNENVYLNSSATGNPSPSCVAEAIVVGASEENDDEWYANGDRGSNYGSCVDLMAPGTRIASAWTTTDTSYASLTGTSMAAPHVTGAAALLLQACPTLSPTSLKETLVGRASVGKIAQVVRDPNHTLSPNRLLYVSSAPCPPSAPLGVAVSRSGSGAIVVTWTSPATGGSSVTSYRATASPGGQTCETSARSCTITGLSNGSTYAITVTAANSYGTGTSSAEVSITVGTPPAAAGAPTAVAGDMNATVSWVAPDNGGLPITGYTVTASPGESTCVTSSALLCTVSGLANGTNYTFSVVATNEVGAGAASPASVAVMPAATWTSGPANVKTKAGSKKVTVSWSPAVLSSGQTTGYVVRDAKGATVCSVGGAAKSCVVSKLKNGSTVTFRLSAVSVANESTPVATPKTVVGGLYQAANAMKRSTSYLLSSIAKTGSKGKMTWSKVSGDCTISGQYVKAGTKKGTCRLRASVAKSSPYPAQKMVFTLNVT